MKIEKIFSYINIKLFFFAFGQTSYDLTCHFKDCGRRKVIETYSDPDAKNYYWNTSKLAEN